MPSAECVAPSCTRRAEYLAAGDDLDGTHFEDRVCGSCASYLMECGATVQPLAESDSWGLRRGPLTAKEHGTHLR